MVVVWVLKDVASLLQFMDMLGYAGISMRSRTCRFGYLPSLIPSRALPMSGNPVLRGHQASTFKDKCKVHEKSKDPT